MTKTKCFAGLALLVLSASVCRANMLTNFSFETPTGTTDFVDTDWTAGGSSGPARELWATRCGIKGGRMAGWDVNKNGYVYQEVAATSGTYTFSIWVRQEEGYTQLTNSLKLGWYDAASSIVQAETVATYVRMPSDDLWHHLYVTGTCTSQTLATVRATFDASWGSPGSGSTAMFFDDAELYEGEHVGTPLSNGSLEKPVNDVDWHWRSSQWHVIPEEGEGVVAFEFNDWAAHSGDWGVGLHGYTSASNNYTATLYQNLVPGTGTYSFAVWMLREWNFILSNAELRIEWYDVTFTNKVQADSVTSFVATNDSAWHEFYVTGACTDADLYEARVVMSYQWPYNTNNVASRGMKIDDARFLSGSYDGNSVKTDWGYYNSSGYESRMEQVPGTNRFGSFLQINYETRSNTLFVLADNPTVAKYAGEDVGVGIRTAWQIPGTSDWFEAYTPMTCVAGVELSSSVSFHGLPGAGTKTVDVWKYEGPQPCDTNGVSYTTNSIRVYYAPYFMTSNGIIENGKQFLVMQNGALTNNLEQLFDTTYMNRDYCYDNLKPTLYTALTNGDFETPDTNGMENSGWNWWGQAGRDPWAARSGVRGGLFCSWDPGDAGIYQYIASTGGTHTFSMWFKRQAGAQPTNTRMRLEWNSSNALLQVDEKDFTSIPGDGLWRHLFITGTCTNSNVSYVRPVFASQFDDGTEENNEGMMFDDAEFYSGTYTGETLVFTNGGFEEGVGTDPERWDCLPSLDQVSRENWATRTDLWGGAFKGWDTNQPEYEATLSQPVNVSAGTYCFSIWARREPEMLLTNAELRIQWCDSTYSKVQADTLVTIDVPNDDSWREYGVTGTCSHAELFEARPTVFAQWQRNEAGGSRCMKLDDAQFGPAGSNDTDGDGIPDDWEILHFGDLTTSGVGSNSDVDVATDWEEWVADTDPNNGSSYYDNQITNALTAGFIIELLAGPPTTNSRIYDAFSTTDLVAGAWGAYGLDVPGETNGAAIILTVTNKSEGCFYRTGVKLP